MKTIIPSSDLIIVRKEDNHNLDDIFDEIETHIKTEEFKSED